MIALHFIARTMTNARLVADGDSFVLPVFDADLDLAYLRASLQSPAIRRHNGAC